MRSLRALTVAELSIVLAIGAFLAAAAITVGTNILSDRSRDSAYMGLRSLATSVQSYGRRAGRLSALGDDPALGIDFVADAELLPRTLVVGATGPGTVSEAVLPTSHRVLARAGALPSAAPPLPGGPDLWIGLPSPRGAVLSVGTRGRPVRDPAFCSGLLSLDLPGRLGVMVRTADWSASSDPLVLAPAAAPAAAFPLTGTVSRAWARPFTYSGLPTALVSVLAANQGVLADLTPAVAATLCNAAVRHPTGLMIVYAIGPAVP